MTKNAGEEQTLSVHVTLQDVASCSLTTPDDKTLDFIPGQPSEHGDRYEILDIDPTNFIKSCSVVVKNLAESDNGIWELVLKMVNGEQTSDKFDLTVNPIGKFLGLSAYLE